MSTAPTTMLAALYTPGNDQVQLVKDYPRPVPAAGEVLLKIKACGVCHSDVFFLTDNADPRTYILGHEACGEAVQLGSNVDPNQINLGQLYAVYDVVGCAQCGGIPSLTAFGVGVDGGYAQYAVVPATSLVVVPNAIPPEIAAVVPDAGVTAYHAIHTTANVQREEKVLIMGVGGLGHLAVQMAKFFGAIVYACDIKPGARNLATQLGADEVFDPQSLAKRAADGTGFFVDTVVDFVVNVSTFDLDFAITKNKALTFGGNSAKIVLVGFSRDDLKVNSVDLISNNVSGKSLNLILQVFARSKIKEPETVLPSVYGSLQDLTEVLNLVAAGAIEPHVQTESLENINEVLHDLRGGEIIARKVIVPPQDE